MQVKLGVETAEKEGGINSKGYKKEEKREPLTTGQEGNTLRVIFLLNTGVQRSI